MGQHFSILELGGHWQTGFASKRRPGPDGLEATSHLGRLGLFDRGSTVKECFTSSIPGPNDINLDPLTYLGQHFVNPFMIPISPFD